MIICWNLKYLSFLKFYFNMTLCKSQHFSPLSGLAISREIPGNTGKYGGNPGQYLEAYSWTYRAFSCDVMLSSNMVASIARTINIHLCKHLLTLLCVMVLHEPFLAYKDKVVRTTSVMKVCINFEYASIPLHWKIHMRLCFTSIVNAEAELLGKYALHCQCNCSWLFWQHQQYYSNNNSSKCAT